MKKIIFISGTPISKIFGEKLEVDHYVQSGFTVEYWNLTRLHYDEKSLIAYFDGHKEFRFKFPREKIFLNKKELEQALQRVESNVVFCSFDFNCHNDYWLRRLFKRYNIQYFGGPRRTSEHYPPQNMLSKIFSVYQVMSDKRTVKRVFSYVRRKLCKVAYCHTNFYQTPMFTVGCGSLGRSEWLNVTQSKRFVSVPSTDLVWQELSNLIDGCYCVYVDDTVVYSPDQNMDKGRQSTSHDLAEYSKNICKVFDIIETKLGCQVVIAASGKYCYPDNKIFGGRKIIYGKTNQLIQHAKLVVGHASSATWQVIVNSKPIIFLWDPSFIRAKNLAVTLQASYLGIKPIMSTELTPTDLQIQMKVNQAHYDSLLEQFFCEKGVTGIPCELIEKELNQYFKHENLKVMDGGND